MKAIESGIGETVKECFRIWDRMKADGATFAERCAALERTLRIIWPFTREWKYLCQSCDDCGLQLHMCPGDATCGRTKPHLEHGYGTPCWCEAGARYRVTPKTPETDVAAAARVKQPTRYGR